MQGDDRRLDADTSDQQEKYRLEISRLRIAKSGKNPSVSELGVSKQVMNQNNACQQDCSSRQSVGEINPSATHGGLRSRGGRRGKVERVSSS